MTTARKYQYRVSHTVSFGGFNCEVLDNGDCLIRAAAWKGSQPRIALRAAEPAAREWRDLAFAKGTSVNEAVEFEASEEAADNLFDQWLSH